MGQSAKRKRQRGQDAQGAGAPDSPPGDDPALAQQRRHRLRLALLILIPLLSIGAAVAAARFLDSRPGAGIALLAGAALWFLAFAVDVGEAIPRRDRNRASGLNFGRKF